MRFPQHHTAARLSGLILLVGTGIVGAGDATAPVPFPTDYRQWAVTRSFLIGPESKNFATLGGFHHYYANQKAMEGFRTGQFPEGSTVIDERLDTSQEDGATLEGRRKYVAVMEKDATRYSTTGGWGFDVFVEENQTRGAAASVRAGCFSCHSQRKDHDFVFTEFRK